MPEMMSIRDIEYDFDFYPLVKIAVVISVFLAVVLMGYICLMGDDKYSSLYVMPDSYSKGFSSVDQVSYTYGVTCYEGSETSYTLKTYCGDSFLKVDSFDLNDGESIEKSEEIKLPDSINYPVKVNLVLESDGKSENIHFWLNN